MKRIAIIPARSGSKGLPDKNILPLNGVPLLAYTIKAALDSGKFDEVMVSTDSEKYAEIARQYGAKVPFLRSAETSGDTASTWSAVREVLEQYALRGQTFDTFTLLQTTSPLRLGKHLQEAFELMKEKNAKTVFSVCQLPMGLEHCFPVGDDLLLTIKEKPGYRQRQVVEKAYHANGSFWICKVDKFMTGESIYEDACYTYIMDRRYSIDVDSLDDFEMAEALVKHLPEFQGYFD